MQLHQQMLWVFHKIILIGVRHIGQDLGLVLAFQHALNMHTHIQVQMEVYQIHIISDGF